MCGIAGFFGSRLISPEAIAATLSTMTHRGPDHQGSFQASYGHNSLTLLHSRLAIIDLDARSNQPFQLPSSVMVFNGEIYNYRELRRELEGAGVSFKTDSDTEVLARWYHYKGAGFEDALEGMWSFALFDLEKQELLLSRDRFGEKPLYMLRTEEGLYFGSEPKFIRTLSGRDLSVDTERLSRFLVYGHRTLFKKAASFFNGVALLPAATTLHIRNDLSSRSVPFWKPNLQIDESMSSKDAIAGVREHFYRSMNIRTRADVPLAFCLSGGVDSGAIVSVAAKELGCTVESFSIIDPDTNFNDIPGP